MENCQMLIDTVLQVTIIFVIVFYYKIIAFRNSRFKTDILINKRQKSLSNSRKVYSIIQVWQDADSILEHILRANTN